jgi:hypothetical protein
MKICDFTERSIIVTPLYEGQKKTTLFFWRFFKIVIWRTMLKLCSLEDNPMTYPKVLVHWAYFIPMQRYPSVKLPLDRAIILQARVYRTHRTPRQFWKKHIKDESNEPLKRRLWKGSSVFFLTRPLKRYICRMLVF